ncbi:MAG: hypothetical protein H0W74_08360 [Sphingosinicella sp.]|nr:hypothetical protein [Sphingosinicella sp.]
MTAAAAMALSAGAPATAQNAGKTAKTPSSFSYDLDKSGRRIPKAGNRVQQADGSWVEEIKQGNCSTVRTGREGEVREVQKCN